MLNAIDTGNIEQVKKLAKDYNELNETNCENKRPIQYAYDKGKYDAVEAIVNNATHPPSNAFQEQHKNNCDTHNDNCPHDNAEFGSVLFDSLRDKKFDITRLLMRRAKEIGMLFTFYSKSDGNEVMHTAIASKVPDDIIIDLLKAGLTLDAKNNEEITPLELAKDEKDLIRLLKIIGTYNKEQQKDVLSKLPTSVIAKLSKKYGLFVAIALQAPEDIIKSLLKPGESLNKNIKEGEILLELAKDEKDLIRLLKVIGTYLKEQHNTNPNQLPTLTISKLDEKILNKSNVDIISSWFTNLGVLEISDTTFTETMVDNIFKSIEKAGRNCTLQKIQLQSKVKLTGDADKNLVVKLAGYPLVTLVSKYMQLSKENLYITHNKLFTKKLVVAYCYWLAKNNEVKNIKLLADKPVAPCLGTILENIPMESTKPNATKSIDLTVSPGVLNVETEDKFNNSNLSRIENLVIDGQLLRANAIEKLTQLISQLPSLSSLNLTGIHIDSTQQSQTAWKNLAAAVANHKNLANIAFLKTNLSEEQILQLVNAPSIEKVGIEEAELTDEKLELITSFTQLPHCALKVIVDGLDSENKSVEAAEKIAQSMINKVPVSKGLDFGRQNLKMLDCVIREYRKAYFYEQGLQEKDVKFTRLFYYFMQHHTETPSYQWMKHLKDYFDRPKLMTCLNQADKARVLTLFIENNHALIIELENHIENTTQYGNENVFKGLQVLMKFATEQNNQQLLAELRKCRENIYQTEHGKLKQKVINAMNDLKAAFKDSFLRTHRVTDVENAIFVVNKVFSKENIISTIDDLMSNLNTGTVSSLKNWFSDKPIQKILDLKKEVQKQINFDKSLQEFAANSMNTTTTETSQYYTGNYSPSPVSQNQGYPYQMGFEPTPGFPHGSQNYGYLATPLSPHTTYLTQIQQGQGNQLPNPQSTIIPGGYVVATNEVQRQIMFFTTHVVPGQNNPTANVVPQQPISGQMLQPGTNSNAMFYYPASSVNEGPDQFGRLYPVPGINNQILNQQPHKTQVEEVKEINQPTTITTTTTSPTTQINSNNQTNTKDPNYVDTNTLENGLPKIPKHEEQPKPKSSNQQPQQTKAKTRTPTYAS